MFCEDPFVAEKGIGRPNFVYCPFVVLDIYLMENLVPSNFLFRVYAITCHACFPDISTHSWCTLHLRSARTNRAYMKQLLSPQDRRLRIQQCRSLCQVEYGFRDTSLCQVRHGFRVMEDECIAFSHDLVCTNYLPTTTSMIWLLLWQGVHWFLHTFAQMAQMPPAFHRPGDRRQMFEKDLDYFRPEPCGPTAKMRCGGELAGSGFSTERMCGETSVMIVLGYSREKNHRLSIVNGAIEIFGRG